MCCRDKNTEGPLSSLKIGIDFLEEVMMSELNVKTQRQRWEEGSQPR